MSENIFKQSTYNSSLWYTTMQVLRRVYFTAVSLIVYILFCYPCVLMICLDIKTFKER